MATYKKVVFILLAIIIVGFLILEGFFWWQGKREKIQLGIASDKFPYRDYTQEELNKMYPQIKNADVPTRVTPEQTYANFREALRTNNLEMAIDQLSKESEKYEENKADLGQAYQQNRFIEIYNNYPENISKDSLYESIAQYYFNYIDKGENRAHFINFIKDLNGDWKIDSL